MMDKSLIILDDEGDTDEEHDKAMIEQIKRESLKQLEESEKAKKGEDLNVSSCDIFYEGDDAKGFFLSSGGTYIYPTNYPIRDYQRNIVHTCLFHNTLVSLPTGLGKTFIAAVVMYNYYRWYPRGKIIFMAPTRPLVSQQMRACYDIMGVPSEDTIELLGNTPVATRKKEWVEKRVFYVTPQTIDNDLKNNVFNPENVKCIIIDEAHRATKNYAYCQVVQQLRDVNIRFRLVALSATPGREIQDVINLIRKLDIAKLELRSESSIDIAPYTHNKKIDSVQVPLSDMVLKVREEFLKIIDKYTRSLKQNKVLTGNTGTLTKFLVMLAKEKYVKTKAQFPHINRDLDRMIQRDFHVTHSLASALENLTTYGLRSFYANLVEVSKETGTCPILGKDTDLKCILDQLKPKLDISSLSNDYAWSHLKFLRLKEILENHFETFNQNGETTKVIIFANFRAVVSEIYELLKPLEPTIKASMFIGQSSGITQQEQKEIMKKFRAGEFNTLIATSVGEEGLDIGEVDLVICFDAQKSPIKLVQRLGRTGRKRNGRCVVLLTQGREAQNFQTCMLTCKNYVDKIINNKSIYANLTTNGPRMIPSHITPSIRCLHIVVKQRVTPAKVSKKKVKEIENPKKKSKKKIDVNAAGEDITTEQTAPKSKKPSTKKSKKEPSNQPASDIRTCFENMTKRKKTIIDYFTQSSEEPASAAVDLNPEVEIVQDQMAEFEQIFEKLETWIEKCSANDELIVDDQLFEIMEHFLVPDSHDQTPVDVMEVEAVLDIEDNDHMDAADEFYNDGFVTSRNEKRIRNIIRAPTQELHKKNSIEPQPDNYPLVSKSMDFSDTFPVDILDDLVSPYECDKPFEKISKTAVDIVRNGSPDLHIQGGSPDLHIQGGSPDLNIQGGSPHLNIQGGSRDLHIHGASPDLYVQCASPDLLGRDSSPDLRGDTRDRGRSENLILKKDEINEKELEREAILNDGNDDLFLNIQSLLPSYVTPEKHQRVQDVANNSISVYQTVDDLFVSDDEEEEQRAENVDIRSYFVSDYDAKDDSPPYVEPMSIDDLFEDSSNDVELPNQNEIADVAVKISEENQTKKYERSQNNDHVIRSPGRDQEWPSSSTPMIASREFNTIVARANANMRKSPDFSTTGGKNNENLSPNLAGNRISKSSSPNLVEGKKTVTSPFTPKRKFSQYFQQQSPDVSELKSQSAISSCRHNLESKFKLNDTSPGNLSERNPLGKGYLSKILFVSDSDEEKAEVKEVKPNNKTVLDESNMFTITQLVDMATEREKKNHVEKLNQTSKEKFVQQKEPVFPIKSQQTGVTSNIVTNADNKENRKVLSGRKLDGLDIVDSSDDEFIVSIESSQSNDMSLINSYTSTRHLAQAKPKLPQTKSFLTTLSYVEEKQIFRKSPPGVDSKSTQNVGPRIDDCNVELGRIQTQDLWIYRQDLCSTKVEHKSKSMDSSSDEDFEFFIPKRNSKKESTVVKNNPKSPLLLSKNKSKPKQEFQIPSSLTQNLKNKKPKHNLSNFNIKEMIEHSRSVDYVKGIYEDKEKLKQKATGNTIGKLGSVQSSNTSGNFTNKNETNRTETGTGKHTFKPPFTLSQSASSKAPKLGIRSQVPSTSKLSLPSTSSSANANPSQGSEKKLEEEFGGMTDAQFEQWLKSMNNEADEPEVVRSQYFEQTPTTNINTILMNNRSHTAGSARKNETGTSRGQNHFSREKTNNFGLKLPSPIPRDVTYISSEEDQEDDFEFFRKTKNKPDIFKNKPSASHNNNNPSKRKDKNIFGTKNTNLTNKKDTAKRSTRRMKSKKPANPYIDVEADVSIANGRGDSSDDDLTNTSSDEMDSSFIDDELDTKDHTMANYLNSVKSPRNQAKFKIPVLSDEVLNMDVFSQAVLPDRTEYMNDSFCVSDEECDMSEDEKSLLELAELRLETERKMKRRKNNEKKKRRRVVRMMSSSDED